MQALPVPSATATTQASPDDRASGFSAVEGGPETRSGTVLLVEAYAAIWLILFGFIWLTFRKQRALNARIDDLETALRKVRKESP
ncbi:MAG: CcmD family protein [Deltaproteobacteria bacterium]|nr:CcmD family protein [Deltaproteobacteria bacterium]